MSYPVHGAGLGFKREMLDALEAQLPAQIGFMEVAPENWINVGGRLGKRLRYFTERYPFVAHGLSLNIGGQAPLDEVFIKQVKAFLETHHMHCYSEHLSYCADEHGHLYDLMPIPFSEEAIEHVVKRIQRVQEILERRIAIENISYYCAPSQQLSEIEFINAVVKRADCDFLIDVNNIYVNSVNHVYNAEAFLKALPAERIAYAHIAGHYHESDTLLIDTHGADVIDPVWNLLNIAYENFGVFPTLLERDFNIPPLEELLGELNTIHRIQACFQPQVAAYA
jgi:uncharacterized protein (UPF0276 family)